MLGAHATLPRQIKVIKLHKGQALIAAAVLFALLGVGGWWSYQAGLLGQWLPAAAPVTVASGQIIIEQAQPVAAMTNAAANENVTTVALAATPAAATTEQVVIAGVAGVNGAPVWDSYGNLLATLDSGAMLDVKAIAGDGGWLLVETAAGEGWTPAADVVAYGLGRLATALLPGVVADAQAPAAAAVIGAVAAPAEDAVAASIAVTALMATVVSDGTNLNIRSGPSTADAVVAKAADGAAYQAVRRNATGDWLLLQLSDDPANTGWASASYLELSGDLQTLPVS